MADNDDKNPIAQEEYKKVTEAMYKQNLELARLYKEVEGLNTDLGVANENLKTMVKQRESLVHLINHKVKSAFTHSKYIFAGMLDGTFGEVSENLKKIAIKGLESDNGGINTINLVLNATNLTSGNIKYDMKPVNLKEILSQSINEKKNPAEAKGLEIETNVKDGDYTVNADATWLKEAINNLIENSIRYTNQGKIIVGLEKSNDKIIISVKDTGIGITEEDKKTLFTEGGRGKESIKVNVDSTGYGLYSVKLIVEAHKGHVRAESEGPGKGSQFYIELPVV